MATAKKSAAKKSTPAKKSAGGAAAKKGAASAKKAAPAKRAAAKTGAKTAAKKSATAKRAPNPAFMKAMTPSAELGAVVGSSPMPRTEITKKVWEYIRKNSLQDATNKRQINADDNLRKVFGGKKSVSMFEMTKLVNQHLK